MKSDLNFQINKKIMGCGIWIKKSNLKQNIIGKQTSSINSIPSISNPSRKVYLIRILNCINNKQIQKIN